MTGHKIRKNKDKLNKNINKRSHSVVKNPDKIDKFGFHGDELDDIEK